MYDLTIRVGNCVTVEALQRLTTKSVHYYVYLANAQ